MAKPQPVEPVKLLVAVLWTDQPSWEQAWERLRQQWGELDFQGADRPFDMTDYYVREMGPRLLRRLIAFAGLVPPESLREAKLFCNDIEDSLAGPHGRRVNLDIGYLDRSKIVLASLKYAGQKIHLGAGVYADPLARFAHGRYQPFEWTFPDFRDGRYDAELGEIRRRYLEQLRDWRRPGTCDEPGAPRPITSSTGDWHNGGRKPTQQ
jgi:hypothetical protein